MKNFPEKLKKALKDKGMAQFELCEKIGMSMNGLKKMMDRGTVRVDTLEDICKVLEVPITYFLDIDIEPVKSEPSGFWQKLFEEASLETQRWKIRAYQLEEQLKQANFSFVSRTSDMLGNTAA